MFIQSEFYEWLDQEGLELPTTAENLWNWVRHYMAEVHNVTGDLPADALEYLESQT